MVGGFIMFCTKIYFSKRYDVQKHCDENITKMYFAMILQYICVFVNTYLYVGIYTFIFANIMMQV